MSGVSRDKWGASGRPFLLWPKFTVTLTKVRAQIQG